MFIYGNKHKMKPLQMEEFFSDKCLYNQNNNTCKFIYYPRISIIIPSHNHENSIIMRKIYI